MDMSFANQALACEYLVKQPDTSGTLGYTPFPKQWIRRLPA
jgi:S-adenosylhomocysteine hydrolase